MTFRQVTPEVLCATKDIVTVCQHDVERLIQMASESPRGRARLCAHVSADSPVHEMLMVYVGDVYVRPHKQLGKSVSYQIISGAAEVYLFNDDGKVVEQILLNRECADGKSFCRVPAEIYRMMIPKSQTVVFQETTCGPFEQSDTRYASWAPEESNPKAIKAFLATLC